MKLMTYNILDGGDDRIGTIIEIINREAPDYLTINEANGFDENNQGRLKDLAKRTGLPNYHLALSGIHDYHVAVLSKYPFKVVEEIKPMIRAGIATVVNTDFGELSIVGTHLAPYSEDLRIPEIELIIEHQSKYDHRILMGDMNSLSPKDGYSKKIVDSFNDVQLKKFTTDRKLRFDVVQKLIDGGYVDVGLLLGDQKVITAPTASNEDVAHAAMRLDYMFVSESLRDKVSTYKVVKNENTEKASDHYPVIVELVA